MKLYLYCILSLFYIGWASTAVMVEYQPFKGNEPSCYDRIEGKKKPGEEWYDLRSCVKKHCSATQKGSTISHYSCGAVGVGPNCRIVTPTEPKPYPDCCPRAVCGPN